MRTVVSFMLCVLIAAAAASPLAAKDNYRIPRGKTIYITKMDNDLDSFLKAEFVKQDVDLKVVMTEDAADLVLSGSSTAESERKWHEGWLTASKDKTTGSIIVSNRATKEMIWAGEAGDRSLMWGAMARGGQRKVASRLISDLKKAVR